MAHTLQAAALAAVPGLRLADAMSLDRVAEHEALPARFFLRVVAVIAAVALLLSTAGIYALVSFTLARRTREIGIRVALGAAPIRIITGVFSKAFMHVGIGVLAGAVPGFFIITSGAEDASGVRATTGIALMLVVCAFVVVVAALACAVPLRRALHIEPTQALRAD
jgi:ABC-type antimicrobial peptide transport system permease subunit